MEKVCSCRIQWASHACSREQRFVVFLKSFGPFKFALHIVKPTKSRTWPCRNICRLPLLSDRKLKTFSCLKNIHYLNILLVAHKEK